MNSNNGDITVRNYQEADRPLLRTLFLASRKANWLWLDDRHWQLEDFDAVTLGEKILVAEIDQAIAGFASLSVQDRFLHNLFIAPQWQRQKVGTALLDACYPLCRGTMALKCLMLNQRALRFYLHNGWRVITTGLAENGEYYLMHYRQPPASSRRNAASTRP